MKIKSMRQACVPRSRKTAQAAKTGIWRLLTISCTGWLRKRIRNVTAKRRLSIPMMISAIAWRGRIFQLPSIQPQKQLWFMAQNGEEAKMWQKCGIFASNRPFWERIGNSGQKRTGTRVWAQIPGISAKKWSSILRLFRNLLSTSKWRIFQIPQDGLLHYLEKFFARLIKNYTTLKWGLCASSPVWISIVWISTIPYGLIANCTICPQIILNSAWGLMGYKSLVQKFNNALNPWNNWWNRR